MTDTNKTTSSNTTDASVGQSLRRRVEARKAELEAAIKGSTLDARTSYDLGIALAEVEGLLTGDLDHIPRVVAVELNTWLEANKHLDEHQAAPRDGASVTTMETFSASG